MFIENGGDPFYGAWQLTYLEPLFTNKIFGKRKEMISESYSQGLCPIAEKIQPTLVQFKTNYLNESEIIEQTDILKKTIQKINLNQKVIS